MSGAKKHELYFPKNEQQEKAIINKGKVCKYHGGKRIIWCSECKLPACVQYCPCEHLLVNILKAAKIAEDNIRKMHRKLEHSLQKIEKQQQIINENEIILKSKNNEDHFPTLASAELGFNVIRGSVDYVYL